MEVNVVIAENLKRLRTTRHLSLGQLAELSGVSKVILSQIEKGDSNPTINTLWKIASGLHVPYTSLLEKLPTTTRIMSKAAIPAQENEDGHYRIYCYYSITPHRNFEWFQLELDAGYSYLAVGHPDQAQEYLVVLEGRLTIETGGERYSLEPEDSLYFAASSQHIYSNDGDVPVKALIMNYYPFNLVIE
ncbi:MAG: XRE family transcriptional regulator [Clostridia bacterium]|nr:XRE family transcriptional regulator [Clostridia bacterium]